MDDYTACFSATPEDVAKDVASMQVLAFYQKELALYARAHIDMPVVDFCIDRDIHPVFKVPMRL